MKYNNEVTISRNDILHLLYFIISMFQNESNHRQSISEKQDFIGGYIDRWINKCTEDIIFNKVLLREKNYEVINDYFLYGSSENSRRSDKNAPDILGLRKKKGEIIKFAEFNNNTWVKCTGMPHIEVKTIKSNHKVVAINSTQLEDDNFYVLVESNFSPDYLISFLSDDIFNDSYLTKLEMDSRFIIKNELNIISQTKKIILPKDQNLGTIKLLTIVKGKDFKNCAIEADERENIYYFDCITEASRDYGREKKNITLEEYFIEKKHKGKKIIPFEADKPNKIIVRSINNTSMYVETLDDCSIYNNNLIKGKIYKIVIKEFIRNKNGKEYISLKQQLIEKYDATEELIKILDSIAKN